MTGEAVAVRMREWASVEGDKEGLYKDEGSVHRDMRLTLGCLVYSVITSGLIQKFYLYSVFPSST